MLVGPLGCEGAVEAFDLPVLPGAVRFDEQLSGAQRGDRRGEVERFPVGERVVGDDPFDAGDAVPGEVDGGASEEPGRGGAAFIWVDLA